MILLKTDRSKIGRLLHMSVRRPFLKTGGVLAILNLTYLGQLLSRKMR